MLRICLVGFLLFVLAGCASMHDGHDRLGMTSGDFHSLSIEDARNHLKDKTIRVVSRTGNIFYFSNTQKAYVWSDLFDHIEVVEWSVDRTPSGDRYMVCFKMFYVKPPSWYYTKSLNLVEFYQVDGNDKYVKECGDYSWFAAVSHISERTDIFNLQSKIKPPVDIETWYGMYRDFDELRAEIKKAAAQ